MHGESARGLRSSSSDDIRAAFNPHYWRPSGATATEFWDVAGLPVHQLPAQMVISADALVDAALAGLDPGETVTIPSLADKAEWDRYEAACRAMSGNISSAIPAPRYNVRQHERLSA